jgi:hypothetical protein
MYLFSFPFSQMSEQRIVVFDGRSPTGTIRTIFRTHRRGAQVLLPQRFRNKIEIRRVFRTKIEILKNGISAKEKSEVGRIFDNFFLVVVDFVGFSLGYFCITFLKNYLTKREDEIFFDASLASRK